MNNKFNKYLKTEIVFPSVVLLVCLLPFILNSLGINFCAIYIFNDEHESSHYHALLEWSAVIIAFLTVILAFSYFIVSRDIIAPIIGVALLCSGIMDSFHTLAALEMVEAAASKEDLIPFTWAVTRTFNALVLIIVAFVCLVIIKKSETCRKSEKCQIYMILIISVVFAVTSYVLINYTITSPHLPQSYFPHSFITRPYDVYPLGLFILAMFIFWRIYVKNRSILTMAIMLEILPLVTLQLYMVFGSSTMFDNDFNIAHYLKIFAYLVFFTGLILDYIRTYRLQKQTTVNLEKTKDKLEKAIANLTISNQELERFAYVASHDLQEPLRSIASYSSLLKNRYGDKLDKTAQSYIKNSCDAAYSMKELVVDLLEHSKLAKSSKLNYEMVNCTKIIDITCNNLVETISLKKAKIIYSKNLPEIKTDAIKMVQLLQNLISNALKYVDKKKIPEIKIGVKKDKESWLFSVKDNGIGVDEQYFEEIFLPFKRLHSKSQYSGTGVGLSICKKIVAKFKGKIWVESKLGKGSSFYFTIPIKS
jgi:signal transduction histidine kinase